MISMMKANLFRKTLDQVVRRKKERRHLRNQILLNNLKNTQLNKSNKERNHKRIKSLKRKAVAKNLNLSNFLMMKRVVEYHLLQRNVKERKLDYLHKNLKLIKQNP